MTPGLTGNNWWTWSASASIPTAQNAAVPAQTAQRWLVLQAWLESEDLKADQVNPAPVIAAVATGDPAQQLTNIASLQFAVVAGPSVGRNVWGYVASQTATEAGSTVVICTVSGDPKVGVAAKPSAALLARAITKNSAGGSTFYLSRLDGAWRVEALGNPSPHLPASCQGWYAGLRTQAGLPAK